MNETIIIQRFYRLRLLKRMINVLNFSDKITQNKDFNTFIQILQDNRIVNMTTFILSKITKISDFDKKNPLSAQTFLTSFLIFGYEDDILNKNHEIIDRNVNLPLINSARNIVLKFTELKNNHSIHKVIIFYRALKLYKNTFDAWKTRDLDSLLDFLCSSYYEIESIIDNLDEENLEYINLCREQQEDIIEKIIYINGQEYFNNYKHTEITLDEKLQRRIEETVYNAYWNILENELNSKPPVFNQLTKILIEIRDLFCEFVPNNEQVKQEINENIDPELIKNMIVNNAFADEDLSTLSRYIISLIKRFQPPVMDEDVNMWEQTMLNHFNKIKTEQV